MSRVAVIGAVNIDICGRPFNPLIMRDSNPGTVTMLSAVFIVSMVFCV